jgi:hypothetical protein
MPDDVCVEALGGAFRLTVMCKVHTWRVATINFPIMDKHGRIGN